MYDQYSVAVANTEATIELTGEEPLNREIKSMNGCRQGRLTSCEW